MDHAPLLFLLWEARDAVRWVSEDEQRIRAFIQLKVSCKRVHPLKLHMRDRIQEECIELGRLDRRDPLERFLLLERFRDKPILRGMSSPYPSRNSCMGRSAWLWSCVSSINACPLYPSCSSTTESCGPPTAAAAGESKEEVYNMVCQPRMANARARLMWSSSSSSRCWTSFVVTRWSRMSSMLNSVLIRA